MCSLMILIWLRCFKLRICHIEDMPRIDIRVTNYKGLNFTKWMTNNVTKGEAGTTDSSNGTQKNLLLIE